jgi:protein involved in polysaccharide export with SLBB domain
MEPSPSADTYLLDTGDRLHIRFYDRYDRDDLNGDYVIGESGQLRLPRIGSFNARKKSPADLERDIRQAVENKGEKLGYFSVEVSRCRPFYIVGLVDRPGSYPFSPGFTVLHAISTAGGLYRAPVGERLSIAETLSRRAALVARRARLQAEKEGSSTISVPRELVQLESSDAADIIAREQAILEQSRQVSGREKSALEHIVAINERETESYRAEIAKLEQRIAEQMQTYTQLKKLHEDKVINQQRFFESVAALDNLQRDRRTISSNLAQANTNLERSERDLAMLQLAESARIVREIGDTEMELDRLKKAAGQSADLAYGMDASSVKGSGGAIATYKIVRRNESGRPEVIKATETTPIMPGDIIEVGSSKISDKAPDKSDKASDQNY